MKFFVAVRTRAEVLDFDELRRIASEHVEVIMVYSDEEVPNEEHCFVDGAMLLRHGYRLDQTYFLCGPGPMIPFLMGEFAKLGVPSKFIRAENNAPDHLCFRNREKSIYHRASGRSDYHYSRRSQRAFGRRD